MLGVLGTAKTGTRLHAEATLASMSVALGGSSLPPLLPPRMIAGAAAADEATGGAKGGPWGTQEPPVDSYLRCLTNPSSGAETHQGLRDAVATEIALASRCLEPCDAANDEVMQTREQAALIARRKGGEGAPGSVATEGMWRSGCIHASRLRFGLSAVGRVLSMVSTGTSVGPDVMPAGTNDNALMDAYHNITPLQRAGSWGRVAAGEEHRIAALLEAPLALAMTAISDPEYFSSLFPEEHAISGASTIVSSGRRTRRHAGVRRSQNNNEPSLAWLDQGEESGRRL